MLLEPFNTPGKAVPKAYVKERFIGLALTSIAVGAGAYALSLRVLGQWPSFIIGLSCGGAMMLFGDQRRMPYTHLDLNEDHLIVHYKDKEPLRIAYTDIEEVCSAPAKSRARAMLALADGYPVFHVPLFAMEDDRHTALLDYLAANGVDYRTVSR